MAPKLPRLRAGEVTRILQRHGFLLVSQRGSHQKWRHPDTGKQVIVPYHKGKQLPLGTLRSIIEGSGISEEAFYTVNPVRAMVASHQA
jgi:predicted RNA binding protein YcfA (HicA-like mRNA interferase family)